MTLDQLVVTTVDVPTLVTTPSPGLAFSDPAYPLAGALRAIGCNCFSIRSVERYRDEVVRRAKREARQVENRIDAFEANLTWKPSDLLAGWLPVLLVCCYAGMLISIPVACVTTSILPFAVVGWGGTIGLLFGIAAAGLHSIQVIRTQRLAPAEVDAHRPVRHLDGLPHRQRPPPEGGLTGQVEWESMHDPTRPRTDWLRWPNPAAYIAEEMKGLFAGYRRNLIQSQPAYIELVSEKAAAQSICERAAMPFGVPVGVGRGYTSTACLADTARRFHESGKSHFIMLLSAPQPA